MADTIAGKDISKRDSLKVIGLTTLAGGAAIVLQQLGLNALQAESRKNKPEFLDIPFGTDLKVKVSGRPDISQIQIFYAGAGVPMTNLNLRQVDGKAGIVPFENGASIIRMPGEIVKDELVRVRVNPNLPSDGERLTLHKEPSTWANVPSDAEFPEGDNVYGINVITINSDLMGDGKAPFENSEGGVLSKVGCGWAVGKLYEKDGKEIFSILGYVPDARALEVITQ